MLRLLVLGVRAQRPRHYYLSFRVLAPGTTAAASFPAASDINVQEANVLPPDMVCRTETASLGKCPEFTNRAFLLRLPCTIEGSSSSSNSSRNSNSNAGAVLAVQLFATPSPEDPAGPIVAGKEVDPLIAHGSIALAGSDVGARLAAGERVMVPLHLSEQEGSNKHQPQLPGGICGQAAQLQSLRSSLAANAAPNLYRSPDTQVLLELHLLHAELPQIPGGSSSMQQTPHSMDLQASAISAARLNQSLEVQQQQQQQQQQQEWVGSRSPGRPGSRNAVPTAAAAAAAEASPQVELFVLVSAAANLPMVPGPDAQQLVPPRAFVTLKSLADVEARRPAQAMTPAAKPTQNPVWSHLLQLSYSERDLPHEQLHIAISHEGSSGQCRALVKGSLRLATLIPGQPYSLAMALSDVCTLYMTLVLGLGAATQHDALQGCGISFRATAASLRLLQLQLTASSQPLQSLLATAGKPNADSGEIWMVWCCRPQPQSRPQQQQQLYVALDGREGCERAGTAVLRSINGSNGLLSAAVVATSDTGDDGAGVGGVVVALPLLCLPETGETLWPTDHMLLLPCWTTSATAAVLELYFQPYISSSSGGKGLPSATCFARLELPYSAIESQQIGRIGFVRDLQLKPVGVAVAAGGRGPNAITCTFEVVAWEIAAYLDHLKQSAAAAAVHASQQAAAAAAAAESNLHVELSSPHPDNSSAVGMLPTTPKLRGNTAPDQSAAAATTQDIRHLDVLATLVGDSLAKQQALERLQRSLDVADSRREATACRIADLQSTNSRLTADLQHLRQLLHEEKGAQAAAISTNSSAANPALANASREELFKQLDIVAAARAKERARNAELVHRLQQLHAEQVDIIELQKQYAELQDAHYQQSQLLTDQNAAAATITALKKAVTDQETVISRLESLLAAAVNRSKDGETWRSTADALQLEVLRLRDELARLAAARPADEIAAAAAHAAAAAAEQQAAAAALVEREGAVAVTIADYESRLLSKESERLAAQMRAEKAEAAATAAQNELLDVTKRYAREIAQLKTKLAEKDAQLLGGFGSLANLYLSELPGCLPALNLNPAMGLPSPGLVAALGLGQNGAVQGFGGLSSGELEGLGMGTGIGISPSWVMPAGAGSTAAAAAAAAARAGVAPNAAAAAGSRITSAGRAGSPKLQPINGDNAAAAAAVATAAGVGYNRRAGTAESVLGTTKPGSPLAPLSAPRFTNSAEGVRSGNGRLGLLQDGSRGSTAAAAATGSPQQRQQQQQRRTRDLQLDIAGSNNDSARSGSPHLGASPATAAAAAAAQSGRFAGTAAAGIPGRNAVAADTSAWKPALQQHQQQQWQQQQCSPGRFAAEQEDDEEEQEQGLEGGGSEYGGSAYTEDGLSATAAHQLQQQKLLQQGRGQQQGGGQLIPSASQRQQQQQQQQQQQRLRSPAGQLMPQYYAESASGVGDDAASGQQQQPAPKTGFRKWFG